MKLKACPFCGAKVKLQTVTVVDDRLTSGMEVFKVICDYTQQGCGAAGPGSLNKKEAKNSWNSRARPWVKHKGGMCPTLAESRIDVMYKSSSTVIDTVASEFYWENDASFPIKAWRFA
jgi:hypothetical protein